MVPSLQTWVQNIASTIKPGRVLEIGSKNINGTVRQYFDNAKEYIGIDMDEGDNVDVVLDAHDLTPYFKTASFDTVICLETLEHDLLFWLTLEQIDKVLKPGGNLFISTPTFGFPYHAYPIHPYLFSKDAFNLLFFKNCDSPSITELFDTAGNKILAGYGIKNAKM